MLCAIPNSRNGGVFVYSVHQYGKRIEMKVISNSRHRAYSDFTHANGQENHLSSRLEAQDAKDLSHPKVAASPEEVLQNLEGDEPLKLSPIRNVDPSHVYNRNATGISYCAILQSTSLILAKVWRETAYS
jgi:hypothetical protein